LILFRHVKTFERSTFQRFNETRGVGGGWLPFEVAAQRSFLYRMASRTILPKLRSRARIS
jgi:hypothetical protein